MERLSVVRQILESVEPELSAEVERAWEEEIIKRVEKIDSGSASGRSWEEIKKDFDSRKKELVQRLSQTRLPWTNSKLCPQNVETDSPISGAIRLRQGQPVTTD